MRGGSCWGQQTCGGGGGALVVATVMAAVRRRRRQRRAVACRTMRSEPSAAAHTPRSASTLGWAKPCMMPISLQKARSGAAWCGRSLSCFTATVRTLSPPALGRHDARKTSAKPPAPTISCSSSSSSPMRRTPCSAASSTLRPPGTAPGGAKSCGPPPPPPPSLPVPSGPHSDCISRRCSGATRQ